MVGIWDNLNYQQDCLPMDIDLGIDLTDKKTTDDRRYGNSRYIFWCYACWEMKNKSLVECIICPLDVALG